MSFHRCQPTPRLAAPVGFVPLLCELPAAFDLPLARFTIPELHRAVVARGLVAQISDATLWRWLSADAIKPWRDHRRIFPRDPAFAEKSVRQQVQNDLQELRNELGGVNKLALGRFMVTVVPLSAGLVDQMITGQLIWGAAAGLIEAWDWRAKRRDVLETHLKAHPTSSLHCSKPLLRRRRRPESAPCGRPRGGVSRNPCRNCPQGLIEMPSQPVAARGSLNSDYTIRCAIPLLDCLEAPG